MLDCWGENIHILPNISINIWGLKYLDNDLPPYINFSTPLRKPKQGVPDVPLLSNAFQLVLGDSKLFFLFFVIFIFSDWDFYYYELL